MRRRISVEDLLSLTPAQQERLQGWWRPQVGDLYLPTLDWKPVQIVIDLKPKGYPLLSIGQCMELLADHGVSLDNFCVGFDETTQEHKGRGWICLLTKPRSDFRANEPIDALFAAVREVL